MDWGSKMPPWDLAELEQNTASKFIGGSGRLDCSVDLKLGGLGEFGGAEKWKEESRVSTMVSSSPRSSKRARVPGNGGQNVSCSVDGCKADLGKCREYHRRHKVCEVHSKTPIVLVGGQEQRFCQQCSRFHMLMEFDETKRSCRKRLDGHNRRRRKPQRETINSGSFFLNHQGTTFSSYPQIIPSPRPQPSWTGIVKAEEDTLYTHHPPVHFINRQQHLPSSFRSYREGKQFPFLQDGNAALGSRMTITPLESSSNRMFPDGLTQVLGSDCALSLLSSPTQSLGIDLSQMAPSDRIPMGQPLMPSLHYGGLGRYSHSQDSSNVSRTGFSCSEVEDDRIGIFHVANGEGSSDGPTQGISFSWQ